MNKKIIAALVLVAVMIIGSWVYLQSRNTKVANTDTEQLNANDETLVSEKDTGNSNSSSNDKDSLPTEDTNPLPPADGKQNVAVTITEPGPSFIRAYANNVLENGTCSVTFTQGESTKTYSVSTEIQPSYTQCNPLQVPEDLSSGTWKVVVSFESDSYVGASEAREFSI